MQGFTDLERAALLAIFAETPELATDLQRQLEHASVVKRENSGGGFFTDIAVSDDVPPADCPHVLGYETHAHVAGLEYGLGLVLYTKEGKLSQLEGHAHGPESTLPLDFERLKFEIYRLPQRRTHPKSPF